MPFVPPTVIREVDEHVAWTARDLEWRSRTERASVEAAEVGYVANLQQHQSQLRAPHVRLIRELEYHELGTVARIEKFGTLDPGESEVLAVAGHRSLIAVMDERAGHCWAEAQGISNDGTLGLLIKAVRENRIAEAEASELWEEIQRWWDYAPVLPLDAYLQGEPIWLPC